MHRKTLHLLAILFRRPILALFLGVFGGTVVLHYVTGEGIVASTGSGPGPNSMPSTTFSSAVCAGSRWKLWNT